MAGNVCISSGSERAFCKIVPQSMSVEGVMMPASVQEVKCDSFYKFGSVGYIKAKLVDSSDSAFQEHIFEFTAYRSNMSVGITSNYPLYWVEPITVTIGHLYQIRVVNGIVTWLEVNPG